MPVDHVRNASKEIARSIGQQKKESREQGILLRLEQFTQLFHLSRFEVDTLLLCLAPEIDPRYEKMFAYLQDDVTRKHPSIDLVLNILTSSIEEKMNARRFFFPNAPLMRHRLLQCFVDPGNKNATFLNNYLKADDRIVNYLLELESIDEALRGFIDHDTPSIAMHSNWVSTDLKERLRKLAEHLKARQHHVVINLTGGGHWEQTACMMTLCNFLDIGLIAFDMEKILSTDNVDFETLFTLLGREAILQNKAIFLKNANGLDDVAKATQFSHLVNAIKRWASHVFVSIKTPLEAQGLLLDKLVLQISIQPLTYEQKLNLWKDAFASPTMPVDDADLAEIAAAFKFSGSQIIQAARTAQNRTIWRNPDRNEIDKKELQKACQIQTNQKLSQLAQKIVPHYAWNDIVLPDDKLAQLREVCDYVKYRPVVYEKWGFDRKLSMGKGLNVLFCGPSGTGKTMAAEIMSGELGFDLYKIDLATLISKYIGETEKNLSQIFNEAESSNAILFFDEADALFGKRSEVRDSHDRYANVEISYLLQKMEEYDGMVILATNLRKNMDDAFVRRMHFTVDFPFPGVPERLRIWQQIWPQSLPQSPDMDFDMMARQLEIAGGNIRNIALSAAFLAAADGQVVRMAAMGGSNGDRHSMKNH